MRWPLRLVVAGLLVGLPGTLSSGQTQEPLAPPRTIFLIGDSTVKNGSDAGSGQLWGWGRFLGDHLDPKQFRVENRALGGRSSRTYRTEGLWDRVLKDVQPGDLVLIQFGHNDGGPIDTGRARASLKGVGEEVREVQIPEKPVETVLTFGWYLRQYVVEARSRGAFPVVLSPVPRNIWSNDGKVARASRDYGFWASEVARTQDVPFVDLNALVADRYELDGRDKVGRDYFTTTDHTHTTEAGAKLNASCVAQGLRGLKSPSVAGAIISPKASKD